MRCVSAAYMRWCSPDSVNQVVEILTELSQKCFKSTGDLNEKRAT
jgi:hypothetical protein